MLGTYERLAHPNILQSSFVPTPMPRAPVAQTAPPPATPTMTSLLGSNPARARADAFLKGLGAMAPGLLMAGAPSTDPGQSAKGWSMATQGFQQGRQGELDRVRAQNLQNMNLKMAQAKAAREKATYKAALGQRQQMLGFAETAATQAEAAGNPEIAAMIRANPEAYIKSVYAKQLEKIKGKPKDRYLPIPQLGVADLSSGIVYTPQGPFRMGPQSTTPASSGTTAQVPPAVPSAASSEASAPGAPALSPQAQERVTEADIRRAKEPTEAEKKVDEIFAKDYNENIGQGGIADASKQITQLAEVKQRLETQEGLTGPLIGLIPEAARPFVVPEAAAAQDAVEEVVQRNLRLILGAQFTAEEGKRLIARAYNPALDQKENAKRLGRLLESMQRALTQKLKAYQYYEENRTLPGYKGAAEFSVDDILKAAELDAAPKRTPSITIRRKN